MSKGHILTYKVGHDINWEDSQNGMKTNDFCLNKGIIQEQMKDQMKTDLKDHIKFTVVSKVMQKSILSLSLFELQMGYRNAKTSAKMNSK